MKVIKEQKFMPVTIVLETKEELVILFKALRYEVNNGNNRGTTDLEMLSALRESLNER